MILAINPTRQELQRLKKRLVLAQKGHKLLKDKQDELVRNFLEIIEDTKELRIQADRDIQAVYQSFSLAEGVVGGANIESLFSMPGAHTDVKSRTKQIMNLKVPEFEVEIIGDPFDYGDARSSVLVDRSVRKYGEMLQTLLKLAELEKASILLAEEIEKTRRRVNALEYIIIPNITDTIKYINLKLAEMERANLTRLMKVKDMLAAKRAEQNAREQVT